MTPSIQIRALAFAIASVVVWQFAVTASAQQPQERLQRQRGTQGEIQNVDLTLPAGDGMLRLTAKMPEEVRVSGQFNYSVRVENITDNITLHDIRIEHQGSGPFEIESATIEGQDGKRQSVNRQVRRTSASQGTEGRQERRNESNESTEDDIVDRADRESPRGRQRQRDGLPAQQDQQDRQQAQQRRQGQRRQGGQSQQRSGSQNAWTIKRLMPGESRTIQVTASADEVGQLRTCLAVTHMLPSICLTTQVVKADLKIVKRAPERTHLCEVIELEYFVQNDGGADVGAFTVKDDLPQGMQTIEGDETLEFDVDELEAGDTRKFVAQVFATRPGTYSSRATADPERGERVRSSNTTTEVVAPELAIEIVGPSVTYIDRTATHTVRITNLGNATARDAELILGTADSLSVVRMGDLRESRQQFTSVSQGKVPTLATKDDQPEDGLGEGVERREVRARPALTDLKNQKVSLGDLEPGQTVALDLTTRTTEAGIHPYSAVAQFYCGEGDIEQRVVARAQTETEFVALSALLVTVVDHEDPIRSGNEVVYSIIVKNQGDAADENVRVTAELPRELQFVDAQGPTEAQAEGQRVSFEPIDRLEPGQTAHWKLTAVADGSGEIRMKVELESDDLEQPIVTREPTRLFQP